jgi:hypothetical protein
MMTSTQYHFVFVTIFMMMMNLTLVPGGPGIVLAGITTGARGAPLKRKLTARVTPACCGCVKHGLG